MSIYNFFLIRPAKTRNGIKKLEKEIEKNEGDSY